jgi:hypothetical protein
MVAALHSLVMMISRASNHRRRMASESRDHLNPIPQRLEVWPHGSGSDSIWSMW